MSDQEFEEMKTSLVNKAVEDFKNMSDETSHYWMHIKAGYYAFEQRFADAEMIKGLSKASMEEFYRARISPSSEQRAKCSTHIVSLHVPVPSEVIRELTPAAVGDETGSEGFQPSPADMTFLQSKPDRAALEAYLRAKKNGAPQVDSLIDNLLRSLDTSLKLLDAQISKTRQDVHLAHFPNIFHDIASLKNGLQIGPGAKPVPDWKSSPLSSLPKL